MWSPSKYSPLDIIHLSHLRFHCWKQPWNSSSLKPFSSDDVSILIVVTSPKCRPRSTNLLLGTRKNRRGLNPASNGDIRARWCNCAPKTQARLMQSVRGHCRGGESIASPPTILVARDAHVSQTLQNLHVESCIDSLTLGCEFVVHNSMAVQKNHQSDFDFWFAFPWFFRSRRIFLFPVSALRLQLDVVLVDPRFVSCDDPFQEFISFLWGFPVNATLSVATFAQEWAVSVQSWRKPFSFPNVPSKSCERMTFPNQVLLLSF